MLKVNASVIFQFPTVGPQDGTRRFTESPMMLSDRVQVNRAVRLLPQQSLIRECVLIDSFRAKAGERGFYQYLRAP